MDKCYFAFEMVAIGLLFIWELGNNDLFLKFLFYNFQKQKSFFYVGNPIKFGRF